MPAAMKRLWWVSTSTSQGAGFTGGVLQVSPCARCCALPSRNYIACKASLLMPCGLSLLAPPPDLLHTRGPMSAQDSSVRNADKHPHKYRCLAAPQPTRARAPCAAWQLCSVRTALLSCSVQYCSMP